MCECLTEQQLEDMVAGILSDTDAGRMRRHLDDCAECRAALEECGANEAYVADIRNELAACRASSSEISSGQMHASTLEFDSVEARRFPALPVDSIPGYRIIREIHRGGQGVVYEAIQLSTKRTVAVKVMLEGPFAGERARWRFEREVRLVAGLKHPNIVVIHDSGIAEGKFYFAMDYVCGQPLDTHVRLSHLSVREIIRIFVKICDALSYAHRRGVIHRDLKPSNILVGEDREPQVLDFGLAKLISTDQAERSRSNLVTTTGQLLGTLAYMSPEQAAADPDAIDTRTDVYTLGVILYCLLTGHTPYRTDEDLEEALRNIREADPARPSRLCREANAELDTIVLKAMHKEPDRRYESAGELKGDLVAWLEGRPISARSDSAFYVLRKLAFRHYFHTSVIAALLASIIGFGGITYHALLRSKESASVLQTINWQFQANNKNLSESLELALARQNENALGWFIAEWHAGRLDGARSYQERMRPESLEYAATRFLLDDSYTVEQFKADVPEEAASLVLFVTGERHLKAGRREEARQAFLRYRELYPGGWRPLVEARLRQLDSEMTEAGQNGSTQPAR